ncbi:MAG TPA: hypothetical protein VIT18_07060 [Terrimicrobiaceae bacterium]
MKLKYDTFTYKIVCEILNVILLFTGFTIIWSVAGFMVNIDSRPHIQGTTSLKNCTLRSATGIPLL